MPVKYQRAFYGMKSWPASLALHVYTQCPWPYRVVDPKSETLLECDEESRLQQIVEEKVSDLNSCHWHSQLSVGRYLK